MRKSRNDLRMGGLQWRKPPFSIQERLEVD
jgi:hypothetical protein